MFERRYFNSNAEAAILERQEANQAAGNGGARPVATQRTLLAKGFAAIEMVFPDADGGYLRKSNFERRVWMPLRTAAGIPKTLVYHDLRHTSASLLLKAEGCSRAAWTQYVQAHVGYVLSPDGWHAG